MSNARPARPTGPLFLASRITALVALILALPLLLVIAAAIVADSGLPVFFHQKRLGLHGRRFRMVKFRKFQAAVGRDTLPLTLAGDPRFSRVGALLAATKLDELPQLWNVLRGEMAIVGPRPEVPEFAACFGVPYERLLDYRPGIFGPSQVAFRNEAACYPVDRQPQEFYREVLFPAKAALDLAYYPSRTALSDIEWVLRGVLAVCGVGGKRGAACAVGTTQAARPTEAPGHDKVIA